MSAIETCYQLGWTDGLPVVPPTRAAVDALPLSRPAVVRELAGSAPGAVHSMTAVGEDAVWLEVKSPPAVTW